MRKTWGRRIALAGWLVACAGDDAPSETAESSDSGEESAVADAGLASLAIVPGVLAEPFDPEQTDYPATVGFLGQSVRVLATPRDEAATVTVGDAPLATGLPSEPFRIDEGPATSIEVQVVAADGATTETYTVEVARASAEALVQEAYVKASNTGAGDRFGQQLALWEDTLAVGATGEGSARLDAGKDDDSAPGTGAAYVFVRDEGAWRQQGFLKASRPSKGDSFGYAVALYEDTLVVSAPFGNAPPAAPGGDPVELAGSVYVFVREGDTWVEQAHLAASNAGSDDRFGWSVALWGDTLVVGARGEDGAGSGVTPPDDDALDGAGAAYVFTRTDGIWTEQAYLKASNPGEDDRFGGAVAVSGDTVVVGAGFEDGSGADPLDDDRSNSGAAYVFVRNNGTWTEQAYLKASNAGDGDGFGLSVAVDGDRIAVGAGKEASAGGSGAAPDPKDDALPASGAVYLFERTEEAWAPSAFLKAANAGSGDEFGRPLALRGDLVVAAARGESSAGTGAGSPAPQDDEALAAGAAYVFAHDGEQWRQVRYLKASNTGPEDFFGWSVAQSGDALAISALQEDSAATGVNGDEADDSAETAGAVYLFR